MILETLENLLDYICEEPGWEDQPEIKTAKLVVETVKRNERIKRYAPEMLNALKRLANAVSDDEDDYPDMGLYRLIMDCREEADTVIRKATGGSQ